MCVCVCVCVYICDSHIDLEKIMFKYHVIKCLYYKHNMYQETEVAWCFSCRVRNSGIWLTFYRCFSPFVSLYSTATVSLQKVRIVQVYGKSG